MISNGFSRPATHYQTRLDWHKLQIADSKASSLTRGPTRPNPIGLSIVQLVRREANILHVASVDIVDCTPLLDIKPYVPAFDRPADLRGGWLDENQKKVKNTKSDERFG